MERDKRFDHIRSNFKSFLSFWIVQAISVSIVLIPFVLITGSSKQTNELLFFLGIGISLIGLIIEAIADFQKFKFKLKYPQKFMHTGIWSKIRHPNYTGEILFWLGITISSTSMLEQSLWLIAYISPLWISIIIILFSGIPPLEKVWNEKYKVDPDFINYYNQSWKLIPLIY